MHTLDSKIAFHPIAKAGLHLPQLFRSLTPFIFQSLATRQSWQLHYLRAETITINLSGLSDVFFSLFSRLQRVHQFITRVFW